MNVKKKFFFFREIIKKTSKIVWCDKILNSTVKSGKIAPPFYNRIDIN